MIMRAEFTGSPIRSMQTMLRTATWNDKTAPTIIPDGIYGKQTTTAVTDFQRKNNLPPTGVMDLATWEKLVPQYEAALIEQEAAEPLQMMFQPGQVIEAGEWNYHMFVVQAILAVLARIHKDFPKAPVSGVLDGETQRCLSHFQSLAGLPETGCLDKATWRALARHYRWAAKDGRGWADQRPRPLEGAKKEPG